MESVKNIIIANDTEAFAGIIRAIKNPRKRAKKIAKEDFLCERFLFWENDNKVVITPRPIQKEILGQIRLLGQKNVENWFPRRGALNLSRAIYEDKNLIKRLKETIKQNPAVTLSPYCYTFEFSQLLQKLRNAGLRFHVDQQPTNKSSLLVEYLSSKVGFRNELRKMSEDSSFIYQPDFYVHENIKGVFGSVDRFYKLGEPCVVKANSGEGGWGVLFLRPQEYPTKDDLFRWLRKELRRDSIWQNGF